MHNAVPNQDIEKVELHWLKFQTKGNPRKISKGANWANTILGFLIQKCANYSKKQLEDITCQHFCFLDCDFQQIR